MERIKTVTFLDESGWHGHVDKALQKDDLGLVAGLIFPEIHLERYSSELSEIISQIEGEYSKLHSRVVFKNGKNQSIRQKVFEWVRNTPELLIVSFAAYPLAMSQHFEQRNSLSSKASLSQWRTASNLKRVRLISEACRDIFLVLDEICETEGSTTKVHFDRMDNAVFEEILNVWNETRLDEFRRIRTYYNPVTKQYKKSELLYKFESEVTYKVKWIEEIINEKTAHSEFLFAADIISNSLNKHLREQIDKYGIGLRLNSTKAIMGYSLEDKIVGGGDNHIFDSIYSNQST